MQMRLTVKQSRKKTTDHAAQPSRSASAGVVKSRGGVSMLECVVAVVIIAGLAAYTVPALSVASEQSRAAEGFEFLCDVARAQAEHLNETGQYSPTLDALNLSRFAPVYFSLDPLHVESGESEDPSWRLALRRERLYPGAPEYTILFTEDGFDPKASTVDLGFLP